MKTKETIQNEYAVSKGFTTWNYLLKLYLSCEDIDGIQEHINELTDLIQKELLSRVSENADKQVWQVLKNDVRKSILNTPIL